MSFENTQDLSTMYTEVEDLLNNIVCKESIKAKLSATSDSDYKFSLYSRAVKQTDSPREYDVPLPLFHSLIPRIPISLAKELISGEKEYESYLNKDEISLLMSHLRNDRINSYVETNNYYRMLLGLPNYEETEYDWFYYKGHPVHELPIDVFYEVTKNGYLKILIQNNPNKPYLQYIGKNIDLIYARGAEQYDILWTGSDSKYNKFRQCFNKERVVFLKTIHSEFLCSTTDYTEARELVTLKLQSVLLYLLESNSNELDKAEFTKEEAIRIWTEFGLSFPKDMPELYRNTTTFLLNYLVSMKGTNYVLEYISDKLFTGIKLYKYFIRKTHRLNMTYPIPDNMRPEDFYKIEFVLRPFYSTNIHDFKENEMDDKILSYDEVVDMDPRWRDADDLRKAVIEGEFSYVESKYLSLNNLVDLSEFSNTFSIFTRILIEHSELLKTRQFFISSASASVDAFSAIVYYLGLLTKFLERKDVKIPDSLDDACNLYGFRIPENIQELRIRFAWFFSKSDFSWLLDQFPDAINDNGSFFNFVVNTDKIIGLDNYMYDLLHSCKDWQEYELASSIFNLVKIVNKSPESYSIVPDSEGITYHRWLLKNSPVLYSVYARVTESEDIFIQEIDSMTQSLLKFFNDATSPTYTPNNINGVVNSFNIITNGVSRYLIYILNLFKSYSCEFLNENVAYYFSEKYNSLQQIPNMRLDGEYTLRTFESNTDWDNVIVTKNNNDLIDDTSTHIEDVFVCTPLGDIKINIIGG
ncbi:MAG: hypothetical protein ACRCX2_20760 [Paraclostridium sp.]